MHPVLPRAVLAAVVAVCVALVAPAASASDVDAAREEVAQLGRDVEAASAEYTQVEQRLQAQQAKVEAADTRVASQVALVEQMEEQIASLAVETFKRGGVDPQLSLLAGGGLELASSGAALTVLAERRALTLKDVEDAQVELERLQTEARAELETVGALQQELAQRRADIEQRLEDAKDVLAVAEAEEKARIEAEAAAEAARAAADARANRSRSAGPTSAAPVASNGQLQTPTPGRQSAFGWRIHPVYGDRRFHSGMDIMTGCGTPVVAAESGTVASASWNGSYGNIIVVEHGNGLSTAYAHLQGFATSGGSVSRGEVIGWVGTTGLSTGCHLHFEVRVGGEAVDPARYI